MLQKLFRTIWGDLTKEEFKKFSLLALTFLFIIGAYWLLRPLKDGIFASTVGIKHQPTAKIISLCFLVPLILVYSKLVDIVKKQTLFYIIGCAYVCAFTVIGFLLSHPTIGLANTVESTSRLLGWASYLMIESYGSLMVALFWSFVASSTDPKTAKKGFPLIIFGAQFGAIAGPTLATFAKILGLPFLIGVTVVTISLVMATITLFHKLIPQKEDKEVKGRKKTGMIAGLKIIFSKGYVLGIFAVATFYEIVGTIIDFQMKILAKQTYVSPEDFTAFLGRFGQAANGIALFFSLIGTSFFIRKFGITFCLTLFPVLTGIVLSVVYVYPSLWIVFSGMVAIRALTYALNNPSKEILYVPTSKDVKFKAKGWIDMFGARSAKAIGATITGAFKHSASALMTYGSLISLAVISVWILAALFVGRRCAQLTESGEIVESNEEMRNREQ
jgi:AAA family ATP:ADP antiporter